MSAHTPGPWVPVSDTAVDGFTRVRVACEEGKAGLVAICSGCRQSTDEDEANARLMAAAPELADALTELRAATVFYLYEPNIDRIEAQKRIDRAQVAASFILKKAGRLP